MKLPYLLLFFSAGFHFCSGQPPTWPATKNWKVYSLQAPAVFTISVDSLRFLQGAPLNRDSVQFYLNSLQQLPEDRTPTWMGAWLGSYESADGQIHKIEIGAYGGYFYDVSSGRYYHLPRPLIRPWQKFITSNIPN